MFSSLFGFPSSNFAKVSSILSISNPIKMQGLFTACFIVGISGIIATDVPEKKPSHPDASLAERSAVWNLLFTDYNTQLHPENTTVKFGIALLDVNLDADNDLMVANTWVRMVWKDNRLKWDANLTNVHIMRVPPAQVWIPDILLYNGITSQITYTDPNVIIWPNGEVLWVPQATLRTLCNLNVTTHPFEEQICNIKIRNGDVYDIQPYWGKLMVDLSDFNDDRKYNVSTNSAVRNEKYYDCCAMPYVDITFTLGLTKNIKGASKTCSSSSAIAE